MKTYNDIYLETRRALRTAGIASPELEARLIVQRAADKTREQYIRDAWLFASPEIEASAETMLSRRLRGEPVAYITGEWEFYSLPMKVDREVLIPRIDSEVIVERAIDLLQACTPPRRVLDLCAGTGCLGLAVAANSHGTRVILAEKFAGAARLCRINTNANSLTRSVLTTKLDALEPPPRLIGKFDMIICNPPYIPSADVDALDESVRNYEPRRALDGGGDGLVFYRKITRLWKSAIAPGGYMLFECGIDQADDVTEILERNGFLDVKVTPDTAGIPRVVEGRLAH